ncbi:glycosyltransferase family 2 protein [Candidatus Daviesbacteria bacterium]|nr:glycosyltransferase family 2 protein [Candidatus Daviesbacteria bacterium]
MSLDPKDFSVIIPTYNRSQFLKKAIHSVLRQDCISFEVIVGDNCSTDDTSKVVKSFKDRRIKYFKNRENLGFAGNIRRCFKRAQGDFIFTLGDDDLILEERTLFEILNAMKKYKTGMGSIGTIYYSHSPKHPSKIFRLSDKVIFVKPGKVKKLPLKALDFNISFFTGLVFDRSLINIAKITDSFTYAYFPFCYDVISKQGIVYLPSLFTVAYISQRFVPYYFNLEKLGSFYMEDYLKMIKEFVDGKDYLQHKKEFLRGGAILLPSIKLFTDNKNYLKVLKKLINLDNSLLTDPKFLLLALTGFLPKIILKTLRGLIIFIWERKTVMQVKKYGYFEKLAKLEV